MFTKSNVYEGVCAVFRMELPENVRTVLAVLRENGFHGYVVGGCVRDACMGQTPHDFDMTTDAKPEEILRCFSGYKTLDTGIRHGTVTVILEHEPFEITTFRIDGDYKDNRHPSAVTFTQKLTDDLARRDFTVNAMAYDGTEFADPFGGMEDIRKKCIRCVGEPERRFREDGLRILRALRFAAVLGFSVEPKTAEALHECRTLLCNISAERLYAELCKLIIGQNAPEILTAYADVFQVFLPQFSLSGAALLGRVPADRITRFSLCINADALQALRADKKTVQAVAQLQSEPITDARHLLHRMGEAQAYRAVDRASALGTLDGIQADKLRRDIRTAVAEGACVRLADLAVRGSDLQKIGLSGTEIGEALDALLEQVLSGTLPNKRDVLLRQIHKKE